MKEIMDEYGDLIVAFIAGIEVIAIVVEIILLGTNPHSLSHFIDFVTAGYL